MIFSNKQIIEILNSFDWDSLKQLNKNLTKVFTALEDIAIEQEKQAFKMKELEEKLEKFIEQFSVVEEIETDTNSPLGIGMKQGSNIYHMTKTMEKEGPQVIPLHEVPIIDLEKAWEKAYPSPT